MTNSISKGDLFASNAVGAFGLALTDKVEEAITHATGLSASSCYAVVQIGSEPNSSIEELRRMLSLEHSSVVRLIDRLEKQELVERQRGMTSDLRQVSIALTEKGEEVFTQIIEARRTVLKRVCNNLEDGEMEMLLGLIGKMMHSAVRPGDDQHFVCRLCDLESCKQEKCLVNLSHPDFYELPETEFKRKVATAATH